MTNGLKVSPQHADNGSHPIGRPDAAWTCPFCALHCDSLALSAASTVPLLSGSHCPKALAMLGSCDRDSARAAQPCIDQAACTLDAAIAQAAAILRGSRQALFAGLATDVAGMRALYPLADACGAVLDHAHGDAVMASVLPMQDRGAFSTTLAEVRNRADLVVCLGTQPSKKTPEFFRRISGLAREIVFVGTPVDPVLQGESGTTVRSLEDIDLHDAVAVLNALCSARKLPDANPELVTLAQQMRDAKYTVLVWSPSDLPGAHPALLVEAMHRLVKTLNRTTRAGGLALSGHDGAATANYVATWLSGVPLRTRVSTALQHEPHLFGSSQLLADASVDTVLWLADLVPHVVPPEHDLPMVVIGHPSLAASFATRHAPTVFIPVATPGISSTGHVFRLDGGIALPLRALRDDGLPSASDVLRALHVALTARGVA